MSNSATPEAASASGVSTLSLLVQRCTLVADDVLEYRLVSWGGELLPSWEPGAHLDVHLPSGLIRSYSLCGDPGDTSYYQIAVLREAEGRGGSMEVHSTQLVGQEVMVKGPRNHFALVEAPHYLLLAGGIGITPIKAMAEHLQRSGASWELRFGGRRRQSMAYAEQLRELAGDRVRLVPEDSQGMLDLEAAIGAAWPGTAVYCCGPAGMIDAARKVAEQAGLDFHSEQFVSASTSSAPLPTSTSDFEVELKRTGVVVMVPPDRSILEVVREVCPGVDSSCEDGFCGTCETPVLEGIPEHRDTVLTEDERESNEVMMICVGRSKSARLVLDL